MIVRRGIFLQATVRTLRCYKLSSTAAEWQAAMEALLPVADHYETTMVARIDVTKALHRNVEREFDSSRKEKNWGKRKLAPDR
jgi:hypothetical protein